jgi:hypothetical protein
MRSICSNSQTATLDSLGSLLQEAKAETAIDRGWSIAQRLATGTASHPHRSPEAEIAWKVLGTLHNESEVETASEKLGSLLQEPKAETAIDKRWSIAQRLAAGTASYPQPQTYSLQLQPHTQWRASKLMSRGIGSMR